MSEGVQQCPAGTLPDADIAIQAGGGKKPSVRRPGQVHDGPLVRVLITPQRKAIGNVGDSDRSRLVCASQVQEVRTCYHVCFFLDEGGGKARHQDVPLDAESEKAESPQ